MLKIATSFFFAFLLATVLLKFVFPQQTSNTTTQDMAASLSSPIPPPAPNRTDLLPISSLRNGSLKGVKVTHRTKVHDSSHDNAFLNNSYYYLDGSYIKDVPQFKLIYDAASDRAFYLHKAQKVLLEISKPSRDLSVLLSKHSNNGCAEHLEHNCSTWLMKAKITLPATSERKTTNEAVSFSFSHEAGVIPLSFFFSKFFSKSKDSDQLKKFKTKVFDPNSVISLGILANGVMKKNGTTFVSYKLDAYEPFSGMKSPTLLVDSKKVSGKCTFDAHWSCRPVHNKD